MRMNPTMNQITLTSDITVEVVQQVGSDTTIAHAAWVSPPHRMPTMYAPFGWLPPDKDGNVCVANEKRVEGLLRTLVEKRHGTPFEHGLLTVYVHAPIKVWREWHRHRIGHSYNEESGRYKDLEPVFYVPPRERPMIRPEGFKSMRPAFDRATDEEYAETLKCLEEGYRGSYTQYQKMLDLMVDRGLARDVLGVGIYSSCWVTTNPRSLMSFLELRTEVRKAKRPSHPLYEIRVAAEKVEEHFSRYWPVTHRLWVENGRIAP